MPDDKSIDKKAAGSSCCPPEKGAAASCCAPSPSGGKKPVKLGFASAPSLKPLAQKPPWAIDEYTAPSGAKVWRVATGLSNADKWGALRSRTTAYRDNYSVPPGLYAVGTPDKNSDVLLSANYKLSFDHLRRELSGLNAWVLVLDTKGINVWCAAGKGSFGTEELVNRIRLSGLDKVVEHRRLVCPQMGAVGVSAHEVKKGSGFFVKFGPVYARDIKKYIEAGYKKSAEMSRARFNMMDRLVLTPMELRPAFAHYPMFAAIILVLFGLQRQGIFFHEAWTGGSPFLIHGLGAIIAGAFVTPLFLPWIPFRSFGLKGLITGGAAAYLVNLLIPPLGVIPLIASYIFFPLASSYIALQFTGSTTFTGMSGVKKELKAGIPVYLGGALVSAMLLLAQKVIDLGGA